MDRRLTTFMRRIVLGAAVLALALSSTDVARAADVDPVNIDVILSMAGTGTFVGKVDHDALTVLEGAVNKSGGVRGRPIHFVFYDDGSQPQNAVQLLNGILDKKPALFLGSSSVGSCQAIAPLVEKAGPVEFCLTPALHATAKSYVFSSSVAIEDELKVLLRYFGAKGLKRLAVMTPIDIGGQEIDASLKAFLAQPDYAKYGITIVAQEHFIPTDLNAIAQMTRIKNAQPQAAIFWASGTPFATQLRDASSIGLDIPIGASNANMTYVQMKQYASFLPKELLFPGQPYLAGQITSRGDRSVQKAFFDGFAGAGIQPDFIDSTSWDPGLIAISALRALGPNATATQVRDWILGLHGFDGIAGSYDFRDGSQRGLTERNIMVMRWDPKKNTWDAVSKLGGAPL